MFRRILLAEEHYSNEGIITHQLDFFGYLSELNINFFALFDYSVLGAQLHIGFQFLLCLFIISGFYSRPTIILSWLLQLSIQNQNIYVLYSGDVVIRQVLFLASFLNLDQVWSLRKK